MCSKEASIEGLGYYLQETLRSLRLQLEHVLQTNGDLEQHMRRCQENQVCGISCVRSVREGLPPRTCRVWGEGGEGTLQGGFGLSN